MISVPKEDVFCGNVEYRLLCVHVPSSGGVRMHFPCSFAFGFSHLQSVVCPRTLPVVTKMMSKSCAYGHCLSVAREKVVLSSSLVDCCLQWHVGLHMLSVTTTTTIIIIEICKAPTLRLKALNKHTHIMYIDMENVSCNLTKANT